MAKSIQLNARSLLVGLLLILFCGACSSTVQTPATSNADSLGAVVADQVAAVAVDSPIIAQALDDSYGILGNGEIVEYCFPYPKAEFTEDYDLAEYKAQHILVSKNKKSRITFSGNPVDMSWDALYADCLADVDAVAGHVWKEKTQQPTYLVLRWSAGGEEHYFKKWNRAAAQETVTAHFAYPAAESQTFAPWIAAVSACDTKCE